MSVRFTIRAARQVASALDYVAVQSPQGASNIRRRLLELLSVVEGHPELGYRTDRPGLRRLVLTPYPYLVDYRIFGEDVVIVRFRHGARRP